jgi:hypothetical protein
MLLLLLLLLLPLQELSQMSRQEMVLALRKTCDMEVGDVLLMPYLTTSLRVVLPSQAWYTAGNL